MGINSIIMPINMATTCVGGSNTYILFENIGIEIQTGNNLTISLSCEDTGMVYDNFGRLSHDLFVVRSDTYPIQVTITDNSVPVDISSDILRLTVNAEPDPESSANELFELVGDVSDGTNGVVVFIPTAEQTTVEPEVYFYDIEWISGATVRTIAFGKFTITADITDPNE